MRKEYDALITLLMTSITLEPGKTLKHKVEDLSEIFQKLGKEVLRRIGPPAFGNYPDILEWISSQLGRCIVESVFFKSTILSF